MRGLTVFDSFRFLTLKAGDFANAQCAGSTKISLFESHAITGFALPLTKCLGKIFLLV